MNSALTLLHLFSKNIFIPHFSYIIIIIIFGFVNCFNKIQNPSILDGKIDLSNHDFSNEGVVKLTGQWEFYPEEFILDFTKKNNPNYFSVPKNWNSIKPTIHFATYRVHIKLKDKTKNLSLKINSIKSAYVLFINKNKIFEMGKIGKNEEDSFPKVTSHYLNIPDSDDNDLEIVIHVSDFHAGESGIWRDILLGSENDIRLIGLHKDAEDLIFLGMFIIIGLYHFGLFTFRRNNYLYLYFGLFTFFLGIRILVVDERIAVRLIKDLPYQLYLRSDFICEFLSIAFFTKFLSYFYLNKFPALPEKIIYWFFIFVTGLCFVFPLGILAQVELTIRPLLIPVGFLYVYVFAQEIKKDTKENLVIIASFLVLFGLLINDILYTLNIIDSTLLSQYGVLVFIIGLSSTISYKLSKSLDESKHLAFQLSQVSKIKDEFMSNLSHELRTPLSLIYAYSELLGDDFMNDPETIHAYAKDIFRETNTLIEIINDLMLVTDLETKFHLKMEDCDLESIVNESILYVDNFVKEKQFHFEIQNFKNTIIRCDRSLISKVFIIIFKNSILYGNIGGTIICNFETLKDQFRIEVSDNGPGIQTEDLENIFEKFFRVDSSITYKVSGVGVGLFIAKRIIEMHGGNIHATNLPNSGLKITIHLPIKF